MTNDYIDNQLVKSLYSETSVSEELALKQLLSDDTQVKKSYDELKSVKDKLDHSMSRPSTSSIQMILEYSRKTQRETSV